VIHHQPLDSLPSITSGKPSANRPQTLCRTRQTVCLSAQSIAGLPRTYTAPETLDAVALISVLATPARAQLSKRPGRVLSPGAGLARWPSMANAAPADPDPNTTAAKAAPWGERKRCRPAQSPRAPAAARPRNIKARRGATAFQRRRNVLCSADR